MLQDQVIPVSFGQGLDTKSDSKQVIPGKFTVLENGVFTSLKRVSKRNGYTKLTNNKIGGGTLSAPHSSYVYKNELLCQDSGHLYGYVPSVPGWKDKGLYESVAVSRTEVSNKTNQQTNQSSALLGNYLLTVYSVPFGSDFLIQYDVIDITTNAKLAIGQYVTSQVNHNAFPKAFTLGSTSLAISYLDGSAHISMVILSISISGVTLGAPITLATDPVLYASIGSGTIQYDVVTTTTGAVLSYSSSATFTGTPNAIKTLTLNTVGTITHTVTESAVLASPLSITNDPVTGNTWLFWADNSTPGMAVMYYLVYSSVLAIVLGETIIGTAFKTVSQMVSVKTSSTTQRLFYSDLTIDANQPTTWDNVYSYDVNVSGSFALNSIYSAGTTIIGKPLTYSGNYYLPVQYVSGPLIDPYQSTGFLINTSSANAQTGAAYSVAKFIVDEGINRRLYPSQPAPFVSLSATKFGFPIPVVINQYTVGGLQFQDTATIIQNFEFSDINANIMQTINDTAILNGGIVQMYDGNLTSELNFNINSYIFSGTQTTAGSIADGVYVYYVIYEWIDNNGNAHRSGLSNGKSVTISAGSGTAAIQLYYSSPIVTQKDYVLDVTAKLFRSLVNTNTYHLVSSVLISSQTAANSYKDVASDATISANELLYTNGGVLSNSAPPPSMIQINRQNRVWFVNDEAESELWYTKSFQNGIGISPSAALIADLDQTGGKVTSLASMDEKLVIFKTNRPLFISGDGANDSGFGSNIGVILDVPADTGSTYHKGTISYPGGVLFKSAKGIYSLDRSLNVSYEGFEVEGYNAQDITSARLIKDHSQIRFLTSSGSSLMYDYILKQWSAFTNHTGYAADIYQDLYTYAKTDGFLYQENTTSFLDGTTAYALKAKTAWMKLAGIQGFQRVKRILLLGDFLTASSHGVQISASYDFGTTFSTPVQYLFTGSNASFQYRERLPIQKCDAIQFYIEEITTGATGEFIDFTDMSLEIAAKKGANKMQGSQSVG